MTTPTPLLVSKLEEIRLCIFDVDGVLTDGRLFYDNQGNEFKAFHAQDGHGMKLLQQAGIAVGIITARNSALVTKRMSDLGIEHVYQGQRDKLLAFNELLNKTQLTAEQVCYVGDDMLDLAVMRRCGLAITVPNGHPMMVEYAHHVTRKQGGEGAAREVCDMLLNAQNKMATLLEFYLR